MLPAGAWSRGPSGVTVAAVFVWAALMHRPVLERAGAVRKRAGIRAQEG